MITAVDTSVLIDVFGADATFGPASRQAVRAAHQAGRLIACDIVWAETASFFQSSEAASDALARLEIEFSATDEQAALTAAAAWKQYRARGGARDRLAADFLIAAHALTQADRLLTRDRGVYRAHFMGLALMDPTAAAPG